MGASGWKYTTPFTPDPEQALQQLRRQVFAEGRYAKPGDLFHIDGVDARALERMMPWPWRAFMAGVRAFFAVTSGLRWVLRGGRGPRTIDELLEDCAEEGTHSILDIERTSDRRDIGVAFPLPEKLRKRHLNRAEPTHEDFERAADGFMDSVGRWEAMYFVLYRNGQPDEYAFVGCSGD